MIFPPHRWHSGCRSFHNSYCLGEGWKSMCNPSGALSFFSAIAYAISTVTSSCPSIRAMSSLQGRARVEDFALDPIPAHDKAAGRVVGRVAAVDQDAQKVRHVVQVRQSPFEARAVLHGQPIASRGDCRAGIDFPFTPAGGAARRIGTRDRQFANRVF